MAGPIENMTNIYKKTFKYTPPSPPTNLIDCSNLTIDFTARKFVNIGIDPSDEFKTVIHVITSSRYVNIPIDFLQSIFRLMGNILSFILDRPEKYKRNLFLETGSISMSSKIYQSENTLVLESKTHDGCRVLLNRTDRLVLQDLEYTIFEIINRKSTVIKPIVIQQIYLIASFLKSNATPQNSMPEMRTRVRNINNDYLSINVIGEDNYIFTNQLKLYATDSIIQKWTENVKKYERYNNVYSTAFSSQSCFSLYPQGNLSSISTLSPPAQESYFENKRESCSENDGPFGPQYN